MKRFLIVATTAILTAALLGGCKTKNEPTATEPSIGTVESPHWQAVEDPLLSGSMTITCVPPSSVTVADGDELGAFIDGVCRGTGTRINGIWYLGISGSETVQTMEIRYYSAAVRKILVQKMYYTPDARLGSTDQPYELSFGSEIAAPRRIEIVCSTSSEAASATRRINRGTTSEDVNHLVWKQGDRVTWYGSSSTQLTAEVSSTDPCSATLTGWVVGDEGEGTATLCYPAGKTTRSSDGFTFSIPAEQTYTAGNFAHDLLPMCGTVAYNESTRGYTAQMMPLAAALCMSLQAGTDTKTVTKITIHRKSEGYDWALSGTFTGNLTATTDPQAMTGYGSEVTLNCGTTQVGTTATKFYFVLPALPLDAGTTFTVHYSDNTSLVKTLNQTIQLAIANTTNLPTITL